MHPEDLQHARHMHSKMREHALEMTGDQDISGLEVAGLIRLLGNLYENAWSQHLDGQEISGPRWELMLRLMAEEKEGCPTGMTPTVLSRCQNVSKNTISALLRGLEEQALIQRTLDPQDRRLFRIQLTEQGRELVRHLAPLRMRQINHMADALSLPEKQQLIGLLVKLVHSIAPVDPVFSKFPRLSAELEKQP